MCYASSFNRKYFLLVSVQLKKNTQMSGFSDYFFIFSKENIIFNISYEKHIWLLSALQESWWELKHIYRENMKIILIMTINSVICKYWYYLDNISILLWSSVNANLNNQKDSCMPEKLTILSAFLISTSKHQTWPVS